MSTLGNKLKLIVEDRTLRMRVLFVLGTLVVFRILAAIPIPGINAFELEQFFAQNQFLGLLNIFSGGGLSRLSVVMLGVGPYITGSIVMQLLTLMVPRLKEMYHHEGENGRKRFMQYSRMLTVPFAILQGFAFLLLLSRSGILPGLTPFDMLVNITIITAGSVFLMWLGEIMTEFGVGNGISILIFAGIVASLPTLASQLLISFDTTQLPLYVGFIALAVLVTAGTVIMTEAERPIPITYAKRVRGSKSYGGVSTYLPLRLNMAGVIPIIFALSFLLFPQMLINLLANVDNTIIAHARDIIQTILSNTLLYGGIYFVLVFLFTFFYTAVTFEPESVAENLQKNGAFIPGVRPGVPTSEYISKVLLRITAVGGLFLGVIAVLPLLLRAYTGNTALALGGTSLLIVVSVVLDLVKKVDAQVSLREY